MCYYCRDIEEDLRQNYSSTSHTLTHILNTIFSRTGKCRFISSIDCPFFHSESHISPRSRQLPAQCASVENQSTISGHWPAANHDNLDSSESSFFNITCLPKVTGNKVQKLLRYIILEF